METPASQRDIELSDVLWLSLHQLRVLDHAEFERSAAALVSACYGKSDRRWQDSGGGSSGDDGSDDPPWD